MNVGIRIKKRREEIGITQEELASRLETSRQTIYNWENGYTSPDATSLDKLSKSLSCSIEYFFREDCGDESKKPENYSCSTNNVLGGNNNSNGADIVKRHWRKIYVILFTSGGAFTFLGIIAKIMYGIFKQGEDEINGNYNSIPGFTYPSGSNSGMSKAEVSIDKVFTILPNIWLGIGIVLIVIGFILLISDCVTQRKYKNGEEASK